MAQLPINYGTAANDGTGTNWRTAFQRAQDNFTDLYALQSRTVNAGDVRFSGEATTEAKIQAAIDQAATELATAVYVPAFMRPYDASLVTFNPAVRMVTEGGAAHNQLDAIAYGATGTINLDLTVPAADLPAYTAATVLAGYATEKRTSSLQVQVSDEGLAQSHLHSAAHYVLIGESLDSNVALVGTNEGTHTSGIEYIEINAGVLADKWWMGKLTTDATAPHTPSALKWYYSTIADWTDATVSNSTGGPRMELTTFGQLIVGGSPDAALRSTAAAGQPGGGIVVYREAGGVANYHLDLTARQNGVILIGAEPHLQILASDSGNAAGMIILTAAPSTGNNRHWLLHHRGVGQNSDFCLQYNTSAASLFDAPTGATTYLTVTTAGQFTFAGRVVTKASAAAAAGLNLPHGAAPTSPVDGDIWTTTAGLFVRINGSTVGPLS